MNLLLKLLPLFLLFVSSVLKAESLALPFDEKCQVRILNPNPEIQFLLYPGTEKLTTLIKEPAEDSSKGDEYIVDFSKKGAQGVPVVYRFLDSQSDSSSGTLHEFVFYTPITNKSIIFSCPSFNYSKNLLLKNRSLAFQAIHLLSQEKQVKKDHLLGQQKEGLTTSSFSWGEFFIYNDIRLHHSRQNKFLSPHVALTKYHKILSELQGISKGSQDNFLNVFNKVVKAIFKKSEMKNYCVSGDSLVHLLVNGCTDCQGEAMLVVSLLMDLNMYIPAPYSIGVEIYCDHIRPVLVDSSQKKLIDLVAGGPWQDIDENIYKPEFLLDQALRQSNSPFTDSEKSKWLSKSPLSDDLNYNENPIWGFPVFIRNSLGINKYGSDLYSYDSINFCKVFSWAPVPEEAQLQHYDLEKEIPLEELYKTEEGGQGDVRNQDSEGSQGDESDSNSTDSQDSQQDRRGEGQGQGDSSNHTGTSEGLEHLSGGIFSSEKLGGWLEKLKSLTHFNWKDIWGGKFGYLTGTGGECIASYVLGKYQDILALSKSGIFNQEDSQKIDKIKSSFPFKDYQSLRKFLIHLSDNDKCDQSQALLEKYPLFESEISNFLEKVTVENYIKKLGVPVPENITENYILLPMDLDDFAGKNIFMLTDSLQEFKNFMKGWKEQPYFEKNIFLEKWLTEAYKKWFQGKDLQQLLHFFQMDSNGLKQITESQLEDVVTSVKKLKALLSLIKSIQNHKSPQEFPFLGYYTYFSVPSRDDVFTPDLRTLLEAASSHFNLLTDHHREILDLFNQKSDKALVNLYKIYEVWTSAVIPLFSHLKGLKTGKSEVHEKNLLTERYKWFSPSSGLYMRMLNDPQYLYTIEPTVEEKEQKDKLVRYLQSHYRVKRKVPNQVKIHLPEKYGPSVCGEGQDRVGSAGSVNGAYLVVQCAQEEYGDDHQWTDKGENTPETHQSQPDKKITSFVAKPETESKEISPDDELKIQEIMREDGEKLNQPLVFRQEVYLNKILFFMLLDLQPEEIYKYPPHRLLLSMSWSESLFDAFKKLKSSNDSNTEEARDPDYFREQFNYWREVRLGKSRFFNGNDEGDQFYIKISDFKVKNKSFLNCLIESGSSYSKDCSRLVPNWLNYQTNTSNRTSWISKNPLYQTGYMVWSLKFENRVDKVFRDQYSDSVFQLSTGFLIDNITDRVVPTGSGYIDINSYYTMRIGDDLYILSSDKAQQNFYSEGNRNIMYFRLYLSEIFVNDHIY